MQWAFIQDILVMWPNTHAHCMSPHGFVLSDDWLSIFDDQQSISPHGFVYISSQHPGISSSANQISQRDYSAHGYQEGLLFFLEESPLVNQKLTGNIRQW